MKLPTIEIPVAEVRVACDTVDVTRRTDIEARHIRGNIRYTAVTPAGDEVDVDANTADRLMRHLMGAT